MANSVVRLRASRMPQMVKNLPFGAVEGRKGGGEDKNHVAPSGGQERNDSEVKWRHQLWSVVW